MTAHLARTERSQALVIVPTFNERDSIVELARRLFDAAGDRVDLLVVDDGSPDGTAEVVRSLAEGPHEIHLIERAEKQGLGTAYIAGFRWAIERGYEYVVEMDADLSHDPAAVPALLDGLEKAELAIGSRYVPGGEVANWGLLRRILSKAGNVYAQLWLGFDVKDSTSGFRAYRTSMIQVFDLGSFRSEGYAFQVEMTWRVARNGGRIVEVPIRFVERTHGRSKLSRAIVFEALLRIPAWALRRGRAKS